MRLKLLPVISLLIVSSVMILVNASPARAQAAPPLKAVLSDGNPPFSYEEGQLPRGLFYDLLKPLFEQHKDFDAQIKPYPWSRAQLMVESGKADIFCTYPSKKRQKYALFTPTPLFTQDYGVLVFSKDNPRSSELANARSFDDLAQFKFISQKGVGWEMDNIPATIERVWANQLETLLHFAFERAAGDFFVMTVEQAKYLADKLGYADKLMYKQVDFIPNSMVAFHIGVRRDFPQAARLVSELEELQLSERFSEVKLEILNRYR
jgi:polar amino acid transport system substrate-binding protein